MQKIDLYTIHTTDSKSNPLNYSEEANEPMFHAIQNPFVEIDENDNETFIDSETMAARLSEFTTEEQATLLAASAILQNKFLDV